MPPTTFATLERRQRDITLWFWALGFEINIPLPHVREEDWEERVKGKHALFYRPPTREVAYDLFMRATWHGQDWTVVDEDRLAIGWEPAETGYWFWMDVQTLCQVQEGLTWHDLTASMCLPSLEEYVIAWTFHRALGEVRFDPAPGLSHGTICHLRTRFGEGALNVSTRRRPRTERFEIGQHSAEQLSTADNSYFGTRAVERVATAE